MGSLDCKVAAEYNGAKWHTDGLSTMVPSGTKTDKRQEYYGKASIMAVEYTLVEFVSQSED